jgi:hypothetical protein
MELGKVIVPQADWRVGEPLALLAEIEGELDLVASVLPMNCPSRQPLRVNLPSGGTAAH